jgi:FecR protein
MDPTDCKSKNELSEQNEYLWSRSGDPDSEVQKLESLLGQFRYDRPVPALPQMAEQRRWWFFPRLRLFAALGVATATFAVVSGIAFIIHGRNTTQIDRQGWEVSRLAGTPRIGREAIHADRQLRRLVAGQVLETDEHSQASLEDSDVGQIEVDAGTRLRLLAMRDGLKQIALDHGTIHAHIWAPPGEFVVETPSAVTVDLGCAYTLTVDDSGSGILRTSLGWVGFKLNGRESFIPSGAACSTRPKIGPGTPYFEDATPEFRAALARFDFEDQTSQQRAKDIAVVLAQSRQRDALTLWHLLSRVEQNHRLRVYKRLQELAPAPEGVTRQGILRLDEPMLDLWWNALGFDDISIWRRWEHSWSEPTSSTPDAGPKVASPTPISPAAK